MKTKKGILISVIAVLLLVIAIITTSYAMFTANLTGTKENKINTGYVTMNCTETTFSLTNTTVMTDAEGIASSDNVATCDLSTTMVGTMTIGYDIALTDVDKETPTDNVSKDNVKIQAFKAIDGGTKSYLVGSTSSAGVLVSNIESETGTYDQTITNYNLDSATIEGNHTIKYTIKTWIDSLPANTSSTNQDLCSDSSYTTKTDCESAGEIWGDSKKENQTGGSFSFKLKIGATQTYTS